MIKNRRTFLTSLFGLCTISHFSFRKQEIATKEVYLTPSSIENERPYLDVPLENGSRKRIYLEKKSNK